MEKYKLSEHSFVSEDTEHIVFSDLTGSSQYRLTHSELDKFLNFYNSNYVSPDIEVLKDPEALDGIRSDPVDNLEMTCFKLQEWLVSGKYGQSFESRLPGDPKINSFLERLVLANRVIARFKEYARLSELRDDIYVHECFIPYPGDPFLRARIFFYFKLDNNGTTYTFLFREDNNE